MRVVGIDPGVSGGIAVVEGKLVIAQFSMPEDPRDLVCVLKSHKHVFIERIPKWCGDAQFQRRQIPGSAMATLYGNFQLCVGICYGLGIKPVLIAPQRWQRLVDCQNVDRLDRGPWKKKLLRRAAELFPDVEITLVTADALLIAHAGGLQS